MRNATNVGISKLYHYDRFKPDDLKETLRNNRVRFSDPARFNDPWDCSPMYVMDDVVTIECVNAWTTFLLKDAVDALTHEQIVRLKQHSLMQHVDFLEDTLKKTTKHSKEITTSRWRIYCLGADPASVLMWAHYANCHTGVCLEFDASMPEIGKAYEVAYQKNRPLIRWQTVSNPTALTEAILLTKSDKWTYEQEFRILCRNGDNDKEPIATLCKTSGGYLELPPSTISRVIVGNKGDFTAVKKLVSDCRPDLKVHQAIISDQEYRVIIPPEYWP